MPKVPGVATKGFNGSQIPHIQSVDVSILEASSARAGRALADMGRSMAGTMGEASDLAQISQQRQDRDTLKDAQADWEVTRNQSEIGHTAEDGTVVKGIGDFDVGDPERTQAWKQVITKWRDNPDGPYAKLSPSALKEFDRFFMVESGRIMAHASRQDVATKDRIRQQTDLAGLEAAERNLQSYVYEDDLFADAADDYADRAARLKAGRMIVNPEEEDSSKLQFRDDVKNEDGTVTGNTRTLFGAARGEALDKIRHNGARTIADGVFEAEHESTALYRIGMATDLADLLPPHLKTDALSALENAKTKRINNIFGAAIATSDLDEQERLVAQAERTAKEYKVGDKTLGAVTEDAKAIRAAALKEEKAIAYEALALSKPYEPGTNERRIAALKWAQPKIEAARRAEAARSLTGNKEFIAGMIGSGAWVSPQGELVAVTTEERRSILRAQLAAGNIRIEDYKAEKDKLDKLEQSGKKEQHEKTAADVCAALGTEIKTLWKDPVAVLDEKEDPKKWVAHATTETVRRELIDETETVGQKSVYTGVGFISQPDTRLTGRKKEIQTVIKKKRDLLASDVPKLINLLMAADSADGILLDLDGNPMTQPTRMDARAYKATLLADVKKRQLSIDIDAQAAVLYGALSARARDNRILEVSAILENAKLRLPTEERDTPEEENDY
jgi:hypothetical protein